MLTALYIFTAYNSQCDICNLNDGTYEVIDDETSSIWINNTIEADGINDDADIVFCKDLLLTIY
jgi:hypothetical protein